MSDSKQLSSKANPLGAVDVAVLGCGLLGGSLALALKQQQPSVKIYAYDTHPQPLVGTRSDQVFDAIVSFERACQAELIVLAAPVLANIELLQALSLKLSTKQTLMDVGSTKTSIQLCAKEVLGANYARFVPAHPIAGSDHSGFTYATAKLFIDKTVILTPDVGTADDAVHKVSALWECVGAKVLQMQASVHDALFAELSHLPHLLAFAFMHTLTQGAEHPELKLHFAGNGLRDFTRIAASDDRVWTDILFDNRKQLTLVLERYCQVLTHYQTLLNDREALQQTIAADAQLRKRMFPTPT